MNEPSLKREHFENGKSFSEKDFSAFLEASRESVKATYTRYLPCLAGGVLVSFLFSKGVGGFIGNMLGNRLYLRGADSGRRAFQEGDRTCQCARGETRHNAKRHRPKRSGTGRTTPSPGATTDTEKQTTHQSAAPTVNAKPAPISPPVHVPAKKTVSAIYRYRRMRRMQSVRSARGRPISCQTIYSMRPPNGAPRTSRRGNLFMGRPFNDADIRRHAGARSFRRIGRLRTLHPHV